MANFLSRSLKSCAPIFRPPFEGLWLVILIYFAWCFLVYPHSQTLRGDFPDTDDYTYATQVLDWLRGQGWYDNVQHRLNPPGGVPIHFSRLTQVPMAGLTLLFEAVGAPLRGAAIMMGLIYPLILLAGFFAALRFLLKNFVPEKWAGLSAFVALFASGPMYMFTPGRIDHHGLIAILMALVLGCVVRMFKEPSAPRWGVAAGAIFALALTVALEVLPWLLIISAAIGLWATAKGGTKEGKAASRNALGYSLALLAGSAVFLLVTRPPATLFTLDVLSYSVVYVILAAGIAFVFAGVALASNIESWLRWMICSGLAIFSGLLFLHRFPELMAGPYGGMNPELAHMMLNDISEAQPLIKSKDGWQAIIIHLGNAFVALAAGFYFLRRAKRDERWTWGLVMAMMTGAAGLTLFYQYRFMTELGMLSIVPLTVLLQRGWVWTGEHEKDRAKVYREIGLLLLCGPLFAVVVPALIDGRDFRAGMLLFPVDYSVTHIPCETFALENILNNPLYFGDRPRLIMASMGQGPEILFRTRHEVLSAPYHMDVTGNIDTTRFFSTPYPQEAEAIVRRRHVDLVVACRFVPDVYLRAPAEEAAKMPAAANGVPGSRDFAPHFIELLLKNEAPNWLKPRIFHGLSNFVIYEVEPAAATQKNRKAK